jgi:hypothetical protein
LVIKRYLNRLTKKYQQQQKPEKKPDGFVNVDYVPDIKNNKSAPGEYVNYEEINDK